MAFCDQCKNDRAYHIQIVFHKGHKIERCDRCGANGQISQPDVFWGRGHNESPNLTDRMGRPVFFHSRRAKARFLRENKVTECGDPVHGTRFRNYDSITKFPERWRHRYGV